MQVSCGGKFKTLGENKFCSPYQVKARATLTSPGRNKSHEHKRRFRLSNFKDAKRIFQFPVDSPAETQSWTRPMLAKVRQTQLFVQVEEKLRSGLKLRPEELISLDFYFCSDTKTHKLDAKIEPALFASTVAHFVTDTRCFVGKGEAGEFAMQFANRLRSVPIVTIAGANDRQAVAICGFLSQRQKQAESGESISELEPPSGEVFEARLATEKSLVYDLAWPTLASELRCEAQRRQMTANPLLASAMSPILREELRSRKEEPQMDSLHKIAVDIIRHRNPGAAAKQEARLGPRGRFDALPPLINGVHKLSLPTSSIEKCVEAYESRAVEKMDFATMLQLAPPPHRDHMRTKFSKIQIITQDSSIYTSMGMIDRGQLARDMLKAWI